MPLEVRQVPALAQCVHEIDHCAPAVVTSGDHGGVFARFLLSGNDAVSVSDIPVVPQPSSVMAGMWRYNLFS